MTTSGCRPFCCASAVNFNLRVDSLFLVSLATPGLRTSVKGDAWVPSGLYHRLNGAGAPLRAGSECKLLKEGGAAGACCVRRGSHQVLLCGRSLMMCHSVTLADALRLCVTLGSCTNPRSTRFLFSFSSCRGSYHETSLYLLVVLHIYCVLSSASWT